MPRCTDCGFLAVRDEYNDDVVEATQWTREKGEHKSSTGKNTGANFLCYQNAEAFTAGAKERVPDRIEAINQEHNCPWFTPEMPGRRPEKIEEMIAYRVAVELQKELVNVQQDIRDIQKRNEEYQKEQSERQSQFEKENRVIARTSVAISAVSVAIALGSLLWHIFG